ncbi:unnamed protein product [Sphenostylis stenocarpa]|uniref:Uncharacterized protein n=1 Tax=Sphenostylis stenocarpa TaxID=92480 RepID=A0AA86VSE6_9FABA|nr:unnamed protein product [Sphenostylis stenocarpa]
MAPKHSKKLDGISEQIVFTKSIESEPHIIINLPNVLSSTRLLYAPTQTITRFRSDAPERSTCRAGTVSHFYFPSKVLGIFNLNPKRERNPSPLAVKKQKKKINRKIKIEIIGNFNFRDSIRVSNL